MKRVDFLKLMSLGIGAGYVLPSHLFSEDIQTATPVVETEELEVTNQLPEQAKPQEPLKEPNFVNSAPGFGNRIALTYDDGPSPGVTDIILKDLDKRKLRATFFMIGKKAEAYKSLAKEVADAGHEISNHTYTHPQLNRLSAKRVEYEIKKAQEVISIATEKEPTWFRPPYGAFRKNQGKIPMGHDLGIAYWSVDPRDWSRPGASRIVKHVAQNTFPGAIVLLHDLHPQTAQATPDVLDQLLERGFNFTTMSGILGHPYEA